jgi:hypothetical protein
MMLNLWITLIKRLHLRLFLSNRVIRLVGAMSAVNFENGDCKDRWRYKSPR